MQSEKFFPLIPSGGMWDASGATPFKFNHPSTQDPRIAPELEGLSNPEFLCVSVWTGMPQCGL